MNWWGFFPAGFALGRPSRREFEQLLGRFFRRQGALVLGNFSSSPFFLVFHGSISPHNFQKIFVAGGEKKRVVVFGAGEGKTL